MRIKQRMARGRLVIAGLAVGLAVTGCAPPDDSDGDQGAGGNDDGAAQAPSEPTPGGSLTVALEAETDGWAPWSDSWAPSGWMVAQSFYDTLMERDEEGEPQPNLAESMEPSDDFTSWTLTLREGIEFHDGEPLDADAVVANIEKHLEPGAVTGGGVAPVEEVTAEDEQTVVFQLDQPHVAFDVYLTGQIGAMASPAAIEAGTVSEEPVGTGAFEFESWQRDQSLEVSANEDYWRDDLPYLEELTFRPIPDEESRLQSLFGGDVDVMQTLRQSIVAQARERSDEYNLYEHLGNNAGATILNTARPPFDDPRVREAFGYAVNQAEIIEVLGGTGITPPAKGLFNPESRWYVEEIEEAWPSQDLERAESALQEYVDDPERSDGKEPGEPVTFDLETPPDPSLLETASIYQDQVGEVGFDMGVETVEQAVHISRATGEPPDFVGEYQAKLWRLGQDTDPDWMVPAFAEGSPNNFTNYASQEFFGLLIEARQTPDFEARRELYHQAQLQLAEDIPFTLSGYTLALIATSDDVYGFDSWELPDGEPGIGHPQSIARWHSVWQHQE